MREEPIKQFDAGSNTQKILTSNGYINFRLMKEHRLCEENVAVNIEVIEPFVHIDTLAQIIYEALKDYDLDSLSVVPIIMVIKSNPVKGIKKEGIYFINFKKEILIPFENIDQADWKVLHEEAKSPLAIGYLSKYECNKVSDISISNVNVKGMVDKVSQIIELHGELTDIITETPMDVATLSFTSIQWIKKKGDC